MMKIPNSLKWVPVPEKQIIHGRESRCIYGEWFYIKDALGHEYVAQYDIVKAAFFIRVHQECGWRVIRSVVDATHYFTLNLDQLSYYIPRHMRIDRFEMSLLETICKSNPTMDLGYRAYRVRSLDYGEERYGASPVYSISGLNALVEDVAGLIDIQLKNTNDGLGLDKYIEKYVFSDRHYDELQKHYSDFYGGELSDQLMAVRHYFDTVNLIYIKSKGWL